MRAWEESFPLFPPFSAREAILPVPAKINGMQLAISGLPCSYLRGQARFRPNASLAFHI